MHRGHKKPTLIEPPVYDSPWQPTYSRHEHIFRGRSDTAAAANEELSLNLVFSFIGEFSLITLIILQIKTITGTETKIVFYLGAILGEKSTL